MPAEQSGHGTVILGGKQGRLGNLVVAASEEGAESNFLSAAAPTGSSRQQTRLLGCSHSSHLSQQLRDS